MTVDEKRAWASRGMLSNVNKRQNKRDLNEEGALTPGRMNVKKRSNTHGLLFVLVGH